MLAHSVHFALVAAGLAGLGALLAPTVAHRSRPRPARDTHDARVGALRAAVARYAAEGSVHALRTPERGAVLESAGSTLLVPLAATSSLAAASVHAALVPAHLQERLVFGAFFVVVAVAQLAWADRALRRPDAGLLLAGAVGNLAVLVLWLTTRTVGLPLALLPEPEAVGAWDVTCAAFEVVVVGACVAGIRLAREGRDVRPAAPWREWSPVVHGWAALVATLLVALAIGGGGH
ncbi:hypothetical protein [Nocardioides sp.]|uniref:hypothetical protein n=1 Tax=Nocardioides sp. TaxID=35761 RepID=UPI003783C6CA